MDKLRVRAFVIPFTHTSLSHSMGHFHITVLVLIVTIQEERNDSGVCGGGVCRRLMFFNGFLPDHSCELRESTSTIHADMQTFDFYMKKRAQVCTASCGISIFGTFKYFCSYRMNCDCMHTFCFHFINKVVNGCGLSGNT